MKKAGILMTLALCGALGLHAATGGPDAFGYTYIDSNEAGGPAYQMVDISMTGTAVGSGDDQLFHGQSIPFSFPFYGNSYSSFDVSTNGWISFGGASSSFFVNDAIPDAITPNNLIAAVWDDLVVTDHIWTESFASCPNAQGGSGKCEVVMWRLAEHYSTSALWDFEVILYENGNILFNHGAGNPELGSGSTTGIENSDGTVGLQYGRNSSYLQDNLAVLFQIAPVTVPLSDSAKALMALLFLGSGFFMMRRRRLAA